MGRLRDPFPSIFAKYLVCDRIYLIKRDGYGAVWKHEI